MTAFLVGYQLHRPCKESGRGQGSGFVLRECAHQHADCVSYALRAPAGTKLLQGLHEEGGWVGASWVSRC